MVRLEGVPKSFCDLLVLDGIDLTVDHGELHVVIGASVDTRPPSDFGLDAWTTALMPPVQDWASRRAPVKWLRWRYNRWAGKPTIYEY